MEYRMNDLLGGKRITNISMKQLSCHASSCNELLNLISLNLENLQFIEFEDFSDDITELDDHALYQMTRNADDLERLHLVSMQKIGSEAMQSLSNITCNVLRNQPQNLNTLTLSELGWTAEQGEDVMEALISS